MPTSLTLTPNPDPNPNPHPNQPGAYFGDCLSLEDIDEMNIEIIRNTLYKAYLEDFHSFCQKARPPLTLTITLTPTLTPTSPSPSTRWCPRAASASEIAS